MILNGVIAVTLRYFTEFVKPALQKTICGGIYARVYCIFSACTRSLQRKFTFAISSPDEFLVTFGGSYVCANFVENRSRNATVRVPTDGQADRLTDANQFYDLSHAVCYSYETDNN